ncbi:MAG: winged helix-turn-helix transcriptional regulator [Aeromicrobium sp.]
MLGKTYDGQYCSVARTLDVVGERWSLLILRDAIVSGVTRFGDFQHNLGIATNVLTSRLEGLIEAGLMERAADGSYRLLEPGEDLKPVILAFVEWGDKWRAPDGPPGLFTHTGCGQPVSIVPQCERHGTIPPDEIEVAPGPGAPPEWVASRRPAKVENG